VPEEDITKQGRSCHEAVIAQHSKPDINTTHGINSSIS
jgi:hypothetical protein